MCPASGASTRWGELTLTDRNPIDASKRRFVSGGLAGWLLGRLARGPARKPRLALVERVALAPRQSVALVEADGRRFLVASSPEGGASFYPLDERARASQRQMRRLSW